MPTRPAIKKLLGILGSALFSLAMRLSFGFSSLGIGSIGISIYRVWRKLIYTLWSLKRM